MQAKAKSGLDGYRADFGAFLASANPNLTKDAVADGLVPRVNSTFDAIDSGVAKDGSSWITTVAPARICERRRAPARGERNATRQRMNPSSHTPDPGSCGADAARRTTSTGTSGHGKRCWIYASCEMPRRESPS